MNGPQPTVYIVDDDDTVRRAISRLLRSDGMRAIEFGSGTEFLAYRRPDGPTCLVLDVRMPGLSGPEVHRQLQSERATIPIVYVSGETGSGARRRAMGAGARSFLSKPLKNGELLAAVRDALDPSRP